VGGPEYRKLGFCRGVVVAPVFRPEIFDVELLKLGAGFSDERKQLGVD
jgi:hypothetical protein